MADTRLYIGNIETLDWVCIAKSYGDWGEIDEYAANEITRILKSDFRGAHCQPTKLVFFTEFDNDLYNKFMDEGQRMGDEPNWDAYFTDD